MTNEPVLPRSDARSLDEVLTAAEARWSRHVETLDWQPGYRIRGPEDPFTAVQEYGHHAHWQEYAASHLRAYLDRTERPAPIEDANAQNDAWAVEDATLSHEVARARAAAARETYIALARQVGRTDERFISNVAWNLVGHFDQHFGYMVAGMLAHESAGWERLTAILDARPEGALHRGEDGVAWDATMVYAHLGRWMEIQFPRVEAFLATGEVPEDLGGTVDELNARWMAEDAALTFSEARRRTFLARDRFVRMVYDLPIERWTSRVVGLCMGNSAGHYQEHLDWIGRSG
ncbi:MAG: hypothetical protein M0R75_00605 [Dehalococcoidia bacterium]|nr:hypothetical protein [Dehalococcoidia bacterium]